MEQKFIEELINIENAARNELNMINCENNFGQLTEIIATKQEILSFIRQFIESVITEPELKQRLLNNLNDKVFNFKLTFGKDSGGINKPIINKRGKPSVYREAWLGVRQFGGKVKTNLKTIRGIIHELAHSVSQKFDLERLNKYGNPHEKDQSIGEIESKFIEQIFNTYMLENAKSLGDKKTLGLTTNQIKYDIDYLEVYDLKDLIEKTKSSRDENDHQKREYDKRYVIGEVVAKIILNKYKYNSSKTISLFSSYLRRNADLNIDEAVRFLTEEECQNYPEIIKKFIKQRTPIIENINTSEIENYNEENNSQIKFFVNEKKRESSQNESIIERDL